MKKIYSIAKTKKRLERFTILILLGIFPLMGFSLNNSLIMNPETQSIPNPEQNSLIESNSECCDSLTIHIPNVADGQCCYGIIYDLKGKCTFEKAVITALNGKKIDVHYDTFGSGPFTGVSEHTVVQSGSLLPTGSNQVLAEICASPVNTGDVAVEIAFITQNDIVCRDTLTLACPIDSSCCKDLELFLDPDLTCCPRITTECDVDSIILKITNGTMYDSQWSGYCSPIPTDFVGLSSYTFIGIQPCPMSMWNCITPTSSDSVTAEYSVYFSNGIECQKSITFSCSSAIDCCDSTSISIAPQDHCCVKAQTQCPLDSVVVSATNAVISSMNSTCYGTTTGYIGASNFTFPLDSCILTNGQICFSPTNLSSSFPPSLAFDFHFSNHETCTKYIDLKECFGEDCCENTKVFIDSTNRCCIGLSTTCEVKTVEVTVNNGTIQSVNSNCTTTATGYIGSDYFLFTFNPCIITNGGICFTPNTPGTSISVTIEFTFLNGQKCKHDIKLEGCLETSCCDSIQIQQLSSPDGNCCALITSSCPVDSVHIQLTNSTFHFAQWSCTDSIPNLYINLTEYTFISNGCSIDLRTRVNPSISGGSPIVHYTVYLSNGEICRDNITLNCTYPPDPCCASAEIDFSNFAPLNNNMSAIVRITNPDPTNPICYIEMSSDPSYPFSNDVLVVDGNTSTLQPWTNSRIPATGSLNPVALNTVNFIISAKKYQGELTVCVYKCDGTSCCFNLNWNRFPKPDITTDLEEISIPDKLVATTFTPTINPQIDEKIKYVLIGLSDQTDIEEGTCQIFAASPDHYIGVGIEIYATLNRKPDNGNIIGVGVELEAVPTGDLGTYNIVFTNKIPLLYCMLIDEDGNIAAYSENIDLKGDDNKVEISASNSGSLNFINLYPNPSNGTFTIKFTTGVLNDVDIKVINSLGQEFKAYSYKDVSPGIHKCDINISNLIPGIYHVILSSGRQLITKSAIIKD